MCHEVGVGIALARVSQTGVEGAPAVVGMIPGDGVVAIHLAFTGRVALFVERQEHIHATARVHDETVPLVVQHPRARQVPSGWMTRVLHHQGGWLDLWVGTKVGSYQTAVPGPIVFGVRGGMDADVAAPRLDEAFESALLSVI